MSEAAAAPGIKLVFPEPMLAELAGAARAEARETFALVLARPALTAAGAWRLLVQSISLPGAGQYETRSTTEVRPNGPFRLDLEKRARLGGLSLIYTHSHPQEPGIPRFSAADDAGEEPLARYAAERVPGVPHLAMVVGAEGCRARVLGAGMPAEVWEVGRRVLRHFPGESGDVSLRFDRQVRAFGEDGQRAIQALRIAIVGLGGTGSVVAQQFAYLGMRRYLLIDPDILDETSLNRVVGARRRDIGHAKVSIAARMIRGIVKGADIVAVEGDVLSASVGELLTDVDFVFCCTDSHGSRFFINQLAYQFFLPCIDMGVVISPQDGRVVHFGGRVQMLAPGLGCLVCNDGTLSPAQVRHDLSDERQRAADPYFAEAADIKQPSVISLNSQVAGQAVTMFLAAVAGIPMDIRSQAIRGMQGVVRALDDTPRPACVNCSPQAFFGQGRRYSLPVRSP